MEHRIARGLGLTLISASLLFVVTASTAQDRVPAEHWARYATPEEAGWSALGIEKAKAFADSIGTAAFMLVHDGAVVATYGDYARRYMCHSVRKSLLSALYGTYVAQGAIDTTWTLAELGITDRTPLTDTERRAKIVDLLRARSGVYLPAAYETPGMAASRPARGSHEPGTFWYYNNWDFNTLAAILRQETGDDIFRGFAERIAGPIGMEDYRTSDGYYHLEPEHSIHPAFPFRMSARDLARFGLLFEREGRWGSDQVIPASWIDASRTAYSNVDRSGITGYGLMWWVLGGELGELGGYTATGVGTQTVTVVPDLDLVFVHRVDTYVGDRVDLTDIFDLLDRLVDARQREASKSPDLVRLEDPPVGASIARLSVDVPQRYEGRYTFPSGRTIEVKYQNAQLTLYSDRFGTFGLMPLSERQFLMEDANETVFFIPSDEGMQTELVMEETLVGEADFLRRGDRIEEAASMLERAVEFYPASAGTRRRYGDMLLAVGDTARALATYQKAFALDPSDIETEVGLARVGAEGYDPPTRRVLRAYVGSYRIQDAELLITERDGTLFIGPSGSPSQSQLEPLTKTRFYGSSHGVEITFTRGRDGRVEGMEVQLPDGTRERWVRIE